MPRIRTMGAGLGGSTAKNVNVNANTGGGNKKQGLSTTTNKRVQFVSPAIKNRSYGENRNVIFCMNQLGGVGAVSGGNGSRMFGTTSDGVKDCITGPYGCEQVVREAYLEAYGREPDVSGLRTYCLAMTKRRWSKADVIADLIKNGDSLAPIHETKPEPEPKATISGSLIDGYIRDAIGGLYDVNDLTTAIETFTTDSFGRYELFTKPDELPTVYTIKFAPGGIDISTGKEVKMELTSTSTKVKALASDETTLNVTPITSLVTLIVKKTEGIADVSDLNYATDVVTKVFNISESDLEKDFIQEGDTNVTKIVTQLETTSNSLSAAISDDSNIVSETVILESIVNKMTDIRERDETIDLADETNITEIVSRFQVVRNHIRHRIYPLPKI